MTILNIEKRIIEFIRKNIYPIAWGAVIILGLIIRVAFKNAVSDDAEKCLLPWYEFIKTNGKIRSIGGLIGTNCNYNLLYRFIIALFTYIPVKGLYMYKIFSGIFDLLLAFLGCGVARDKGQWNRLVIFSAIWMSPIVFLNSAWWAQCDSIYSFFAILSIVAMIDEKYFQSFIFAGISFSFKLQFVFVMPFLVFMYLYKKRFSIVNFLIIPTMLFISGIPAFLMGKEISSFFMIYVNQARGKDDISLLYPSIWNVLDSGCTSGESLKPAALCVTFVILGLLLCYSLVSADFYDNNRLLFLAMILTYTCVLFLPSMHERYGYIYEILSIIVASKYKRTIPLAIALNTIDLICYGSLLFNYYEFPIPSVFLAIANTVVYIMYLGLFTINSKKLEEQS